MSQTDFGWQPSDNPLYHEAMAVCAGVADRPPAAVAGIIESLGAATASARYLQGGLLLRLREGERWKVLEPELSFGEFTRARFGFNRSTADYLIAIYQKAQLLGLSIEKLAEVGWSKVVEFLRVATPEDVNDWIEKAKNQTRDQLRGEVQARKRASRGGGEQIELDRETTRAWTIHLTPDQWEHVEATMEAASELLPKKEGVMPNRGAAFDAVCASFMSLHLDRSRALPWYIRNIERAFGVKLEVTTTGEEVNGNGQGHEEGIEEGRQEEGVLNA